MLTKCDLTNLETTVTYSLNSYTAPLRRFEPKPQRRTTTDRDKMEVHGVNPAFSYKGGMGIDLEGDLFGDDSTAYVAERKLLVAVIENATNANHPTLRSTHRLTIGLSGETEDWYVDGIIQEWSAPVTALAPSRSEFLITLFGWLPYFIGATTSNRHYW